jgi:hypothetical protein
MNRRKFITELALSAGGILVAKELLSTKTYFLSPYGGWRQWATGGKLLYAAGDVLIGDITYFEFVLPNDASMRSIRIRKPGEVYTHIVHYQGKQRIPS